MIPTTEQNFQPNHVPRRLINIGTYMFEYNRLESKSLKNKAELSEGSLPE